MKKKKGKYNYKQLGSAVIMIAALVWLTISAPFVYASQQELSKHTKMVSSNDLDCSEEESGTSLGNNTEEKKPTGGNSFSEEYLHDHPANDHFITVSSPYYHAEKVSDYIAFHGEVQVPPPNIA